MTKRDRQTYSPLNTLKAVAHEVWIVDGPLIEFGPPLLRIPFSTRMTVLRIGRELFIHSPTPLTAGLKAEIAEIGEPAWIIGPNRIHYWWIPQWCEAYPDAVAYLAPRSEQQAGDRLDRVSDRCRPLDDRSGYPWDDTIDTLPVHGSYMSEIVFFHRPSRTLVLTDLIENFEPQKLGLFAGVLTWLGGVQHPDGKMPYDLRLTYWAQTAALRAAVERMIGWDPARIILAHGRWYERDGADELRRAFRWLVTS